MEPLNSIGAIIRRISMVISILIMLAVTIWLVVIWPSIPDTVPTHFGSDGTPNSWGGKTSLLLPLVFGWIAVIMLIVMEFFPQLWNIPGQGNLRVTFGKSTGQNSNPPKTPGAMAAMRNMLAVDRVMIALLFAMVTYFSAKCRNLPSALLIVFLVVMFGASAFFAVRASKLNK